MEHPVTDSGGPEMKKDIKRREIGLVKKEGIKRREIGPEKKEGIKRREMMGGRRKSPVFVLKTCSRKEVELKLVLE